MSCNREEAKQIDMCRTNKDEGILALPFFKNKFLHWKIVQNFFHLSKKQKKQEKIGEEEFFFKVFLVPPFSSEGMVNLVLSIHPLTTGSRM